MTTLEEVFLRANGDIEDESKPKTEILPGTDAFFAQKADENRNSSLNNGKRVSEGEE